MRTRCFESVIELLSDDVQKRPDIFLRLKKTKIPVDLYFYNRKDIKVDRLYLVQVSSAEYLELKWKNDFEIEDGKRGTILGRGIVLNPVSSRVRGKNIKKRLSFLNQLRGLKKDMLLALVLEKDIHGLKEREIFDFCSISKQSIREICQSLEEEGKIRIISFSPFFLISNESLQLLMNKIVAFVEEFHHKHPEEQGVDFAKIEKKYKVQNRVLTLALKHLETKKLIKEAGDKIALASFKVSLSRDDEKILGELEKMCQQGEFRSVSLDFIRKSFKLSSKRMNTLLSLLIENRKVIQGRDGLLIHSYWLNEIIAKIRDSKRKELTVTDFKRLTGLTRKFAIPLLELLDQMGVTRRKNSSVREII
jgi:selenocysteine-specific elongation factor